MAVDNFNNNNQSGYTSKPSDNNFSQGTSSYSQGSTSTSTFNKENIVNQIPDVVDQVINQIFSALQPRIREFALGWATRAVDVSDQSARQLVSRARSKPIYTIGAVALLVVGLGLILGNDSSRRLSPHELH